MFRVPAVIIVALVALLSALLPACASPDDVGVGTTVVKDDGDALGDGQPDADRSDDDPAGDAVASAERPANATTAPTAGSDPDAGAAGVATGPGQGGDAPGTPPPVPPPLQPPPPPQIQSVDPAGLPAYEVVDVPGDDTLNVRSAPGPGSSVIHELNPWATGVSRTGRFAEVNGVEWWEILVVGEREGWSSSRFLQPVTDPDHVPRFRVVNVPSDDTLNVRSGPGTDNEVVLELPHDAFDLISSEVVGETAVVDGDIWWQIHDPDYVHLGWVHSGFLAYQGRY